MYGNEVRESLEYWDICEKTRNGGRAWEGKLEGSPGLVHWEPRGYSALYSLCYDFTQESWGTQLKDLKWQEIQSNLHFQIFS